MKKIFLSLSVGLLLLGPPVTQAAFMPYPIVAAASGSNTAVASGIAPVVPAPGFKEITGVTKRKKVSFFARIKGALSAFGGEKSQLIALLLVLFLGTLGVHRFYLGYTWQGIAQALLFVGGIGLYIAGIATLVVAAAGGAVVWPAVAVIGLLLSLAGSIWVLVDLIRIVTGGLGPKDGSYDSTL